MDWTPALLSFGANLGHPRETFQLVQQALKEEAGLECDAASSLHATPAIGGAPGQPDFLNGSLRLRTTLPPERLVDRLLQVETRLGRTRDQRWDARRVDLDLLLLSDQVITQPNCLVPHPRMSFRRFMLEPAAEIAGQWRHPICDLTISQLLNRIRSVPRTCLYLGDLSGLASTARIEHLRQWAAEKGYQLETRQFAAENFQEIDQVRLCLIDAPRPDRIQSPYLEVANMTITQLRQEFVAAIEAIEG